MHPPMILMLTTHYPNISNPTNSSIQISMPSYSIITTIQNDFITIATYLIFNPTEDQSQ